MRNSIDIKKYVLGIDGGGTKTLCALYDLQGDMHIIKQYGPTNHEDFQEGFQECRRKLFDILDDLLNTGEIFREQIVYSVFGMAGVDTKKQHQKMSDIIRDYGLTQFSLLNDAYLGIMAGSTNNTGICAINGTGFCVTGLDPEGNAVQGGGIGPLTGDKGGGGYLFEQCVSHVYDSLYKHGCATLLKEKLFILLGITDASDFIERMMEQKELHQEDLILNVNKILYQAAKEGDTVAIDILSEVGECYAKTILGVTERLQFDHNKKIPLILAGSQFTKAESEISISTIKSKLENDFITVGAYSYDLIRLEYPCVLGAVSFALKKAGCKENLHEKVMREYDIRQRYQNKISDRMQ